VRSLSRRGVQTGKGSAAGHKVAPAAELTVCERCLAVYSRRTWRRRAKLSPQRLEHALWRLCPACKQSNQDQFFGQVLVRGAFARDNQEAIRKRIANVDARARFTQPEHQVIAVEGMAVETVPEEARRGRGTARGETNVLEVRTTSQKLAHRIVRELKKAFRGRATYHWSDADGALQAVWQRDS